ncbi:MAG: NFACT family protein [Clostridia bacterium]|nr:NFACT family protein [Clostridia bacterium]
MPLDGLTLGFVARELNAMLAGARIERVSQPEKDMLLLSLRSNGKGCRLLLSAAPGMARAHLTEAQFVNPAEPPVFCMLLRKHLTGGRILSIDQLGGDRVLLFSLEAQDELGILHPYELYLEAMGRYSNLTLVRDGRIVDAIRHVTDSMSRVRQALPGLPFIPPPMQDKLSPSEADAGSLYERLSSCSGRLDKALAQHIAGLSNVSARELTLRLCAYEESELEHSSLHALCEQLDALLHRLPSMAAPTILTDKDGLPLEALPFRFLSFPSELQFPASSLSLAMEQCFDSRDRRERIQQRTAGLRRTIRNYLERSEKKLALQEEELQNASHSEEYRVMGELLTAQLHLVPRGAEKVTLDNYYDGKQLDIPLDVRLSPSQNAQRYFKRYQKARAAARLAGEQKERSLREITLLEEALCDLDSCETEADLSDVRAALTSAGLLKPAPSKKKGNADRRPSQPMRFEAGDGTQLSVGKNALQNERLTQAAKGDDLWLHAKDMPGSHVIIHAEGKPVSEEALRCALQLASWYSSAHGVSVPVDAVERRYVKKPSGTPAGFVTFTHQATYLISVTEAEIRKINRIR